MRSRLVIIVLLLIIAYCPTGRAQNPTNSPEGSTIHAETRDGISNLVAQSFPRWDTDHNGLLTILELDAAITDTTVTGKEAALAVILRRDAVLHGMSQAEALAQFAGWSQTAIMSNFDGQGKRQELSRFYHHVSNMSNSASRTLFIRDEPNLDSFHQGRVGDCFLLSRIATLVYSKPQRVRRMIVPSGNGYDVHFAGDANVLVPNLTDGELLMGVRNGPKQGVWLSVLEEAYTLMQAKVGAEKGTSNSQLPKIVLEQGHRAHSDLFLPVCELLTGHREQRISTTTGVAVNGPAPRNTGNKAVLKRISELLVETLNEKRMVTVATTHDPSKLRPKHVPGGHSYAVLAFDSANGVATVFNPWGNTVKPDGPPGLVNGYQTTNGVFEVPLNQLVQIFSYFTIETTERAPYPFVK